MKMKQNTWPYCMLLVFKSHRKRAVCNFVALSLLRINADCFRPTPVLSIQDRLQQPKLVGSIMNGQLFQVSISDVRLEVNGLEVTEDDIKSSNFIP